ncbi:DNA polymerase III subunit beta [Bifidobacterium magnum]|uniref:Beta sliding clamp n=1 Tax=Bifidobacterium magnum TaxID=1692 RepID=A0A087B7Y1_9BIFI|nr:DNA polymerase III subunit beta [Bifidobacterium magnum]KFI67131.1 DNA polymerase III, beta subunit [Bifidobacterium magnum]
MKVEVNSTSLADAVAWATRALDNRPNNPILAGIKLETVDGLLQLSTFSLTMTARDRIEAGVDEDGTVVVRGKMLSDISRMLPGEKTYLATEGSRLRITSGKSTFSLQLMPVEEYPDLPQLPPLVGEVDAATFAQAVNQANVSVAPIDGPRPVLSCIRTQFVGNTVIMSSTDRFRLSRAMVEWEPADAEVDVSALIPGDRLRELAHSLDMHTTVKISFDPQNPKLVGFENGGRVSTLQLIEGEFPSVDRLYADEYPIHAVINRQDLLDAIKRMSLVTGQNESLRMTFTNEEVTLTAGNSEEAQANEILDVDLDGEDITLAFNPNYLQNGIAAISEPYVRMKMTTPIKPVEFDGQESKDSDESMQYRYLLVPMRIGN